MKISEPKVNIEVKIRPFGHAHIEIKGGEETREFKLQRIPEYIEPKTTNQQIIEITFGGEEYRIPKTTGGLF